VRNYLTDVFSILLVRIGSVVGTVFAYFLNLPRILKVTIAYQITLMVHCKVTIGIVVVGQSNLPVGVGGKLIPADHCRSVFVSAVVDNVFSIIAPHFMTYPVCSLSGKSSRVAQGIGALGPYTDQLILLVVV